LGGAAKAMHPMLMQDYYKHKNIEHILILSGDQLYRMDYMELVQVGDILYYFHILVVFFLSFLTA
jgi:ADP-glucose pyrophosphorylase